MIPKYRAWDKINNRFVRISDFVFDEDGSIKEVGTEFLDFGIDPSFDYVDLMQITNLTECEDSEGNKVTAWQGDIADIGWSDQVGEPHSGRIVIKAPLEYTADEARYLVHADYIVIVGNIYENPELIKVR